MLCASMRILAYAHQCKVKLITDHCSSTETETPCVTHWLSEISIKYWPPPVDCCFLFDVACRIQVYLYARF